MKRIVCAPSTARAPLQRHSCVAWAAKRGTRGAKEPATPHAHTCHPHHSNINEQQRKLQQYNSDTVNNPYTSNTHHNLQQKQQQQQHPVTAAAAAAAAKEAAHLQSSSGLWLSSTPSSLRSTALARRTASSAQKSPSKITGTCFQTTGGRAVDSGVHTYIQADLLRAY